MESPRVAVEPQAQASEGVTPGASVAAQHGDRNASAFGTPGPPSPGQASPTRHRSQEGNLSAILGHSSAQLEAAAAALAPAGDSSLAAASAALAAASVPTEPLSRPRLRVQGTDIILEDASSPKAAAAAVVVANGMSAANGVPLAAASTTAAASSPLAAAAAAAAAANHHGDTQQSPSAAAHQQQHSGLLGATARTAQSHELELQLRMASRTATGASNMALASSKAHVSLPHLLMDDRVRGLDGAGDGEMGPSSSSPAAVEGPVRMKYRSTLTEENVAYLNKLDQYSSRPDSSERIWRWLEGSGPPFDSPPPSLGVPTVNKSSHAGGSRRQAGKHGGLFSCFNCFGGGQQQHQ